MWLFGRFQAKGIASAKALREKHAWRVPDTVRMLVWLEGSEG